MHGDPLTEGWDRVLVFEQLIRIGAESDRQHALNCLRTIVGDPAETPRDRCWAAGSLLDAGPEFHTGLAEHLHTLTDRHLDVEVTAKAWRELLKIGTTFQAQAFAALSDLMCQEGSDGGIPDDAALAFMSSNTKQIERAASVMMTVLTDETRSNRVRCQAGRHLMTLGRRYHRRAVEGLRDVLLSSPDPAQNFRVSVSGCIGAGTGIRTYLGDALRDVLLDPRSPSGRRWQAARALIRLGVDLGPEAAVVLRTIMSDGSADLSVRNDAAIALAWVDPGCLDTVAAHVLQRRDQLWVYPWWSAVLDLADLGVDVVPQLRAILADDDVHVATLGTAAILLDVLGSDIVTARTSLARQADDEHMPFEWASEAWTNLVQTDPTAVERAVSYYREVFEDTNECMSNRASAARYLARLDRSRAQQVLEFLKGAAEDAELSPIERSTSIECLNRLRRSGSGVLNSLLTAEIHNPWSTYHAQTRLMTLLSRKTRTEVERGLLADHSIPIEDRLPVRDSWGDLPLAAEAETEVRDVLTAVESRPAERVDAAAALAQLAWQLTPEAVRLLEDLVERQCAPDQARRKLAGLGHEPRQDVMAWAEAVVRDDAQSRRVRYRAAALVMNLTNDPPSCVAEFVQSIARDERTSDRDRVDALFALRHQSGLSALRALRDDERQAPAARWRAAEMLFDRMVEDRATGLRVLQEIATDSAVRPALRWRVAQSLARLGVPGRQRAVDVLHTMLRDTTLPVTARANGARVLVDITASGRRDVLSVLRGLLSTSNALFRLDVVDAIGVIDAPAAAGELRSMIGDERIGPVARLRCAEALVRLRRDQRETAALVARAIAWDESIPVQVRRHAAGDLARWSDLCRGEARELIDALRGRGQRSVG